MRQAEEERRVQFEEAKRRKAEAVRAAGVERQEHIRQAQASMECQMEERMHPIERGAWRMHASLPSYVCLYVSVCIL